MPSKFRLNSDNLFSREKDEELKNPRRVIFLSVEGNVTEQQYFRYIEFYRRKLGIESRIHVHPLCRSKNDNLCAPKDVLELLEEYIEVRNTDSLPKRIRALIPTVYSDEFVAQYLNDELDDEKRKDEFRCVLQEAGLDLEYEHFLSTYSGDDDVFGVVLDRDYKNHTITQLNSLIEQCRAKKYHCYLTTPLFEFWLLLHLADVKSEYGSALELMRINDKVSKNHTYTSALVSKLGGHSKHISKEIFENKYLPNVEFAINQAKTSFCTQLSDLVGNENNICGELGTTIPELFDLLREKY